MLGFKLDAWDYLTFVISLAVLAVVIQLGGIFVGHLLLVH
jgi:hypothetical protein